MGPEMSSRKFVEILRVNKGEFCRQIPMFTTQNALASLGSCNNRVSVKKTMLAVWATKGSQKPEIWPACLAGQFPWRLGEGEARVAGEEIVRLCPRIREGRKDITPQ